MEAGNDVAVSPTGNGALQQESEQGAEAKVVNTALHDGRDDGHDRWWQVGEPHGQRGVAVAIAETNDLEEVVRRVQDQVGPLVNGNGYPNQGHAKEVQGYI